MKVNGEPVALHYGSSQLPSVVGKDRGRGPDVGDILRARSRHPVDEDLVCDETSDRIPVAPVARAEVTQVVANDLVSV